MFALSRKRDITRKVLRLKF